MNTELVKVIPEEPKKKRKVISKTENYNLRYDFTAAEMHDFSLQLAQETNKVASLEEEKKAITSQYTANIKESKATCNKLSTLITNGWEIREVECEVIYHKPKKGQKTIIRKDNGQSIVEQMKPDEYNLFTQPEEETEDIFQ